MLVFHHPALVFVVSVVWAAVITDSASWIKNEHGKDKVDSFDDHAVSYNFIDDYLRQKGHSDSGMGDDIWRLLYHNPSAQYSSGLAFRKRSQFLGYGKLPLRLKRQQGWHNPYGKLDTDRKRNRMWYDGYEKRDEVDEASATGRFPAPSMVLHPPWYGHSTAARQSQFVNYDKRQQGWHTSFGKRQQGWHNPYG